MAQMGTPDMKLPIQYALFYPDRRPMDGKRVDFFELGQMTFEKPDIDTFVGLKLAYQAAETGGSMPTVYNAANEKAEIREQASPSLVFPPSTMMLSPDARRYTPNIDAAIAR